MHRPPPWDCPGRCGNQWACPPPYPRKAAHLEVFTAGFSSGSTRSKMESKPSTLTPQWPVSRKCAWTNILYKAFCSILPAFFPKQAPTKSSEHVARKTRSPVTHTHIYIYIYIHIYIYTHIHIYLYLYLYIYLSLYIYMYIYMDAHTRFIYVYRCVCTARECRHVPGPYTPRPNMNSKIENTG
jgi:hypothetical protein